MGSHACKAYHILAVTTKYADDVEKAQENYAVLIEKVIIALFDDLRNTLFLQ